jgi:peptide/nickel transport system substrate-binding protein
MRSRHSSILLANMLIAVVLILSACTSASVTETKSPTAVPNAVVETPITSTSQVIVVPTNTSTGSEIVTPANTSTPEVDEAALLKEKTLIIVYPFVPGGFDSDVAVPGAWEALVNMNEPLLLYATKIDPVTGISAIDPSNLLPNLATSWKVSDDGKVYEFSLKKGVLSNYGNGFTAADVVWSWEKSQAEGRTGAFFYKMDKIEKIEAIDDYTVRFTLSDPSTFFLLNLAHMTPGIYDSTEMLKHTTQDDPWALEWLKTNYAGFGAYMIESISPGEEAVFVVNPNFHREAPYFKRVIIREVPEASTRASLVSAGAVDIAGSLNFKDIVDFKNQGLEEYLNIYSFTNSNTHARIMLNPNFEPWNDQRVRQAFAYAINHQSIVDIVFSGMATISKSPLDPLMECYTPEFYTYDQDIARARTLLADAGFPNGVDVVLTYSDRDFWEEQFAIQVQASAAEAGFNITLEKITGAEMLARAAIGKRDIPAFTMSYRSVLLDPVYSLLGASVPSGAATRNDYNNPELVQVIATAQVESDSTRRCELLKQAQQIEVEDAVWIGDTIVPLTLVTSKDVTGWVWNSDSQVRWLDLYRK